MPPNQGARKVSGSECRAYMRGQQSVEFFIYPLHPHLSLMVFLVSWVSASHMATLCSPFSILPMRDPKSGNVGVITTAETKENGVLLMQSHLSSNNIARDPKAFSVGQTAWNQKDKTSDADRFKLRIGELHSRKPV